jgi:hypothetical protein
MAYAPWLEPTFKNKNSSKEPKEEEKEGPYVPSFGLNEK